MNTPDPEDLYSERDKILSLLARLAFEQGYNVGIGIDEDNPTVWKHVLYMDLPTGQVSWHLLEEELEWFSFLPNYNDSWDKHNKIEKYNRLLKYSKNYRYYHRKESEKE